MIQVFVHNSNIQRGQCGACQSRPATWTITGQVLMLGQAKTDICDECLKTFDIPAWSRSAQRRITFAVEKVVEEAMHEQRI